MIQTKRLEIMKVQYHERLEIMKVRKIVILHVTIKINHLRDQSVKVCICRALDVKRTSTDIINGLIIEQYRHISMFQERVS